jgi:cytochrome c oxidase cbb3-type subunit 1
MHGLPFIQSVIDMQSYYLWRGVGGLLMFLSHIVFGWNVWHMCYGPGAVASPLQLLRAEEAVA